MLWTASAFGHSVGCDGRPVPENIKKVCCGKADAHLLGERWRNPETGEIEDWPLPTQNAKGDWVLTIAGSKGAWADKEIIPSPDGCYWAFWRRYDPHGCYDEATECHPTADKQKWSVSFYCLLVPMEF